jgi:hypothetical protein
MLDVFGFPSPQQSNYQEFYGGGTTRDWVKPRGASMVRFMLIGPGGDGADGDGTNGGGGGGSGAVTSWVGPAIFVPDILRIVIGAPTNDTTVVYQAKDGSGYTLLSASNGGEGVPSTGSAGVGGTAMTANYFTAAGIFNSVAGQNGTVGSLGSSPITASATTFLSGGAGGSDTGAGGGSVTPNYGYAVIPQTTGGSAQRGNNGYFITQPILVGTGGAGGSTSGTNGGAGGRGGIGCGGGGKGLDASPNATLASGGDGAVFVWSW